MVIAIYLLIFIGSFLVFNAIATYSVGSWRKWQLQQVQDVHLKSLTATLWASDTKELRTHLEGISQLRDMQFLESFVYFSLGKIIFA